MFPLSLWANRHILFRNVFFMKGGDMRKFGFGSLFTLILIFVAGFLLSPLYAGSDPPTMTKEELKAHLGVQGFVIIDVRKASDWKESENKIKNAVREDPDSAKDWATKYPKDKAIVLYCA
jgi:hypothetical protein